MNTTVLVLFDGDGEWGDPPTLLGVFSTESKVAEYILETQDLRNRKYKKYRKFFASLDAGKVPKGYDVIEVEIDSHERP